MVTAFFVLALVAPVSVTAHEARPLVVEVDQTEDFSVTIDFRVPGTLDRRLKPQANLPDGCAKSGESPTINSDGAYRYRDDYQCPESLSGQTIAIEFPYGNPSLSALVLVTLPNGESHTKLLLPGDDHWLLPAEPTASAVVGDYTALGIGHIWLGFDHLLFVLCLLFIAGTKWRILATITGFTVAHSLTLALAALGHIKVSTGAVEAIIALSIVFLAAEIIRNDRLSIAWRKPMVVAVGFGLLHGLGFASVLADIGLPQLHQVKALLFFNLGVEIGQILFIGAVILAVRLIQGISAHRSKFRLEPALRVASVYSIGIAGSFWFVERSLTTWI